jgi:hypothetical protein
MVRVASNKSSAVMYVDGHSANVEYQDGNRIGPALVSGGIYEFTYSSVDVAWKLPAPSDGRTPAEQSAGVTPVNFQYPFGDCRRYNILTTNTAAANVTAINAFGAGTWAENVALKVPIGSYPINDTVTLPGPYISLEMDAGAVFLYSGAFDRPAIVLGSTAQRFEARYFNVSVTTSSNTYASQNCVGVRLKGSWNDCYVRLNHASGFTINFQLYADNALGMAYNIFDMGRSVNGQYHLDLHSFAASGFINENLFLNGNFITDGNTYSSTRTVYAVTFRSEAGTYTGHNNNVFKKPSFQLGQAGVSADRIPVWFNESGGINAFSDCRAEDFNGPLVRVSSSAVEVRENVVEFAYVSALNGVMSAALEETDGGYSYGNRVTTRTLIPTETYNSGDLLNRAWSVTAGNIAVQGMFMQTEGSATEVYSGAGKIGKDYLLLNSYAAGVYVDTSVHKNFEWRWRFFPERGGRPHIVAYNAAGAAITSTRAVYFSAVAQSAGYDYRFHTPSDSTTGVLVFRVDSTVKRIKLIFSPGTNPLYLKSFSITAICSEPLAGGLSVYGGPSSIEHQIIAGTIPSTALGSGYSLLGMTVNNNGSSTPWRCTAAGWNPLAWTITTAVILNELRSNGGNTYVCVTAGTTAGAGGPTGTGTGIADNTAVWDYVGFPVTTVATWT